MSIRHKLRMLLSVLGLGLSVVSIKAVAQAGQAGDVAIANRFVAAIAKNGRVDDVRSIDANVSVATLLRNPVTHSMVPKQSGSGLSSLAAQTAVLFKMVGKPKGTSCRQGSMFIACKFEYALPTSAWIAAITVSNSKIVRVDYIYVTPNDLKALGL